ncbi:hypothetical protein BH09PSE5_BH09PSE5_08520 [soil metagenome]
MCEIEIISTSIQASPEAVYDFASNPANLSKWASRLAAGIEEKDGRWFAQ